MTLVVVVESGRKKQTRQIKIHSLRKFKKGATDDLVNDNATLIDEYGSIDFLDTVRTQVLNSISR